jgi:hypothetical membrane protein
MNRLLLAAGMAGPVVFLVTVVLGAEAQPGYSHVTHAVSELTQRGAPNAFWISIGFAVSAVLCGVFGMGVLQHARPGDAALRRTGWLLLAYAFLAILPGTVFPMDPFGHEMTFPGLMHIVLVAAAAVVLIALLILGGRALRDRQPWFPGYSWASIAAMLAGGLLSAYAGIRGIPMLGAAERLTQTRPWPEIRRRWSSIGSSHRPLSPRLRTICSRRPPRPAISPPACRAWSSSSTHPAAMYGWGGTRICSRASTASWRGYDVH